MATFKENLEKIEKAVYGKDVRTAIHDSIEQCMSNMQSGVGECKKNVSDVYAVTNTILDMLSLPVEISKTAGKVWYMYTTGDPGKIEQVSANEYCECAAIPVSPGDTYLLTIGNDSSSGGGSYSTAPNVMIAAADGDCYRYEKGYSEANYSEIQWMITVPESSVQMYLLIYSTGVNIGGIHEVRKLRI